VPASPRLLLPLLALACAPAPEPAPVLQADDAARARTTDHRLLAPELIQGATAELAVERLPAGARVYFFASDQGEGITNTPWLDLELEQAFFIGEAIANGSGRASLSASIPADWTPRAITLQAGIYASGQVEKTRVIQRHITVPRANAASRFDDATTSSGIGLLAMTGNSHTGGAAWVDVNNDHWPDLFVTNGGGLPHYLFRNDGDGTFTDISDRVPKPDLALEDAGVSYADVDNDGDLDLFVAVDHPDYMAPVEYNVREGGPNLLYLNDGTGHFVESAAAWGAVDALGRRTIEGVFADVDRDGFVDLYVDTWAMNHQPGVYDHTPTLLRNDQGQGFVDATVGSGLEHDGRDNLVSLFFDANDDGWPDLYQGNVSGGFDPPYVHTDGLYINDGTGAFLEAGASWPGFGDDAGAAMGADIGDVDGDGHYDLYITDIFDRVPTAGYDALPAGNVLYKGRADGTLDDNSCDEAGICSGYIGWPANFTDFDRDGWVDLWVGNSAPGEPEMLFWNRGDGTFEHHDLGPLPDNDAKGGSVADYDGDGAMDIFIQNTLEPCTLLRNEASDDHHYLAIKLFGVTSNRAAIGADISVTTSDGLSQRRRVSGGDSAHSQQDLILHVGLGEHTDAEVTVTWPSGAVDVLGTLGADTLWFAEEHTGVLDETLTLAEASYDTVEGLLTVTAQSRFGGRTELSVDGFGPLAWDPDTVAFAGSYATGSAPPSLTVTSSRGATFTVVPDLVP